MEYTKHTQSNRPIRHHLAAAGGSIVLLGAMNAVLNASYAASKHPVSYAEGQTTFDAMAIKGFYATMEAAGTLSIYVRTQLLDFGFIAAMVFVGITVGTLLVRINQQNTRSRQAGKVVTNAVLTGASFDVLENLVSFVMLARPQTFPDLLAIPYSSFAVLKFGSITIGMVAATFSAAGWSVNQIRSLLIRRGAIAVDGSVS